MKPSQPTSALPASPIPDPVRAFLAEPRVATIATINADGSPHQAVVWYALDGDDLLINSRRGRRWPGNLARDGRISVAVHEGTRRSHWVGVKGQAEQVREGDAAVADIQAFARRYGKDPAQYAGQDRVTFRIAVASTFEYGADE
ncbi:MAG TPA: TIGR03618 family F420-dependent PPOX class oxidoreductase [Candidatus Limnocylindrales bacterium]|nr:TIGR03618 family F420-dependent PPOX class oxidoreductase [Candidatus Limnocylindrales bacterium]